MEGCIDMSVMPECEVILTESYPEEDDSKNITFLQNFIDVYQSLPELWNPKHPAYKNKAKRSLALDVMTNVYRKIKPRANHGDVRRKINTLRSNYRKDLNKIVASIRSGCRPEEVYRPTSWVFHALKFLQDCELPNQTNENNRDDGSQSSTDSCLIEKYMSEPPNTSRLQSPILSRSPTVSSLPPTKKQKLLEHLSQQKELSSSACRCIDKSKDNVPTVAKVWGEKYLALDMQQRLFAEKAINDVLFEASLGNLHRHSVKINEEPNRQRNSVVIRSSTGGEVKPFLTRDIKQSVSSSDEDVKP